MIGEKKQHRYVIQLPEHSDSQSIIREVSLGFPLTAGEHFDRAMKAQREGNWALYGEEIKKLGEVIRKMQK